MIAEQVTYTCDMCGRSESFEKGEHDFQEFKKSLPDGWRKVDPYGDICAKCCEELDGVYNRIHAHIKAREDAYGNKR